MTSRERDVLTLLAEGCSNTVIARRLHVTESTVKRHVESPAASRVTPPATTSTVPRKCLAAASTAATGPVPGGTRKIGPGV